MSAILLAGGGAAAPLTVGAVIEFVKALAIRPARQAVRAASEPDRAQAFRDESVPGSAPGSVPSSAPLENMTVLIVDDNETNIYVLQAFLAAFGPGEILSARGGEEALDLLRSRDCDVIFMDIQMPGLDGVATTQAIRNFASESRAKAPIIAVTAACRIFGPGDATDAGMDGYVEKPVNRETLRREIEKAARLVKERRRQDTA